MNADYDQLRHITDLYAIVHKSFREPDYIIRTVSLQYSITSCISLLQCSFSGHFMLNLS